MPYTLSVLLFQKEQRVTGKGGEEDRMAGQSMAFV